MLLLLWWRLIELLLLLWWWRLVELLLLVGLLGLLLEVGSGQEGSQPQQNTGGCHACLAKPLLLTLHWFCVGWLAGLRGATQVKVARRAESYRPVNLVHPDQARPAGIPYLPN